MSAVHLMRPLNDFGVQDWPCGSARMLWCNHVHIKAGAIEAFAQRALVWVPKLIRLCAEAGVLKF